MHGEKQIVHAGRSDGIEPRGGLVAEQELRFCDDGSREAGALAHAAGKFIGVIVGEVPESDHSEHAYGFGAQFLLCESEMFRQGEADVFCQGQGAEHGTILEEHAHGSAHAAEVAARHGEKVQAADPDLAAHGMREADDLPEESGLAAAGAAQNDRNGAAREFPGDVREHHVVPVAGFEMAEFNVPACHEKGPF